MMAVILVYMTPIMYNVKGEQRREISMKVTREQAVRNRERIVETGPSDSASEASKESALPTS